MSSGATLRVMSIAVTRMSPARRTSVRHWNAALTRTLNSVREDLTSITDRDPAARTPLEVALLYPGVHAVLAHRVSHALWQRGAKLPARAISQAARLLTQIEIHPGATIGPRLFIDHGSGVVIGETAEIGADVTIYHGVTLGGTSLDVGKRHPTIGDRVTIGAGAKVLGNLVVGADSRIGANAVLVRTVDIRSVVVGVPGQVIASSRTTVPPAVSAEPDPVGRAVQDLLTRVQRLEAETGTTSVNGGGFYSRDGVWEPDDFSI